MLDSADIGTLRNTLALLRDKARALNAQEKRETKRLKVPKPPTIAGQQLFNPVPYIPNTMVFIPNDFPNSFEMNSHQPDFGSPHQAQFTPLQQNRVDQSTVVEHLASMPRDDAASRRYELHRDYPFQVDHPEALEDSAEEGKDTLLPPPRTLRPTRTSSRLAAKRKRRLQDLN